MKIRKLRVAALLTATACATMMMLAACGEKPVEHTHTLQEVAAVAATCTTAGTEAYYKCTDPECGKLFSDDKGETEITAAKVVPAKGHNMTKHEAVTATCTGEGTVEYYTCANEAADVYYADDQGAQKLETISTPKTNHQLVVVPKIEATCGATGTEAYWNCLTCQHKFSDDKGEHEIDAPIEIPKSKEHGASIGTMTQEQFDFYNGTAFPVETGGEIEQVCSICGAKLTAMKYDVGVKDVTTVNTKQAELDIGKVYYVTTRIQETKNYNDQPAEINYTQSMYLGFKVSEPGKYVLSFTDLLPKEGEVRGLNYMWISSKYETRTAWADISGGKVADDIASREKVNSIAVTLNPTVDLSVGGVVNIKSITFTITPESISTYGSQTGELFIKAGFEYYAANAASGALERINERVVPLLVSVQKEQG